MSDASNQTSALASTAFVLHGARDILSLSAGTVQIERQITALEEAVDRNTGLAFDLAKVLIETICKTILNDRGHPCDSAWDLPKLFKETTGKLQLLPDSHATDAKMTEAFRRTSGALSTVVNGMSEIRNLGGFASHGKDAHEQLIEDTIQAQFVARAADTVVHFLFRTHTNYSTGIVRHPPLEYDHNPDYNSFIDDSHVPVTIFGLEYKPSEVLFNIDNEAYRDGLAGFKNSAADDETT